MQMYGSTEELRKIKINEVCDKVLWPKHYDARTSSRK